jgi:hypothetical protein
MIEKPLGSVTYVMCDEFGYQKLILFGQRMMHSIVVNFPIAKFTKTKCDHLTVSEKQKRAYDYLPTGT